MTRNLLAFALAAALGCGSKTPPPTSPLPPDKTAAKTPPPDEVKKDEPPPTNGDTPAEAKAIAMMKQIGAIMAASAGDCAKAGADLKKFTTENKAAMAELKDMDKKETPEQKSAFEKRHNDDIEKFVGDIMPVAQKCKDDPAFADAMKELN